jgi:hypothetical protein
VTTVSDMNIVVQQGGNVRDVQQIRHPSSDVSQLAAAQQPEKEVLQRTTVAGSDEAEKLALDQQRLSERKKRWLRQRNRKVKKKDAVRSAGETGHLVNTVV